LRNNLIVDDDRFAGEIALDSPALFQRWVMHEAVLALQGQPVLGVVSPRSKSSTAATDGTFAAGQSDCGSPVPVTADGKVK
jgi:hypothetical protein